MPKKKWEKPKLIVLVRGCRQEMVLADCKRFTNWGPDDGGGACLDSSCGSDCSGPAPS